jgi:hypothetical protein
VFLELEELLPHVQHRFAVASMTSMRGAKVNTRKRSVNGHAMPSKYAASASLSAPRLAVGGA